MGDAKGAWFKDTEGNIMALIQTSEGRRSCPRRRHSKRRGRRSAKARPRRRRRGIRGGGDRAHSRGEARRPFCQTGDCHRTVEGTPCGRGAAAAAEERQRTHEAERQVGQGASRDPAVTVPFAGGQGCPPGRVASRSVTEGPVPPGDRRGEAEAGAGPQGRRQASVENARREQASVVIESPRHFCRTWGRDRIRAETFTPPSAYAAEGRSGRGDGAMAPVVPGVRAGGVRGEVSNPSR